MSIETILKNGKNQYVVYVNGFDSRGKRIQKRRRGIETLRKAEVAEFELKRELAILKEESFSVRWPEWVTECLKRMSLTHQPSTVFNYEKQLNKCVNKHWNNLEIKKITRADVHKMIFETINHDIKMNTRRWIFDMIKRLFQMAVEDGILSHNPALGIQVKVPEVEQKVLTNSEVEILLREARNVNHRFYTTWVVALKTGMRSGELYALKWTDIDFDAKLILVTKQWTSKSGFCPTKTRKNRIVPISTDLLVFLKELKLSQGQSEFVLPRSDEWENGAQAKALRDFCSAIGITEVKFHDLRATFITNLLARGESLARVMSMVGHTQIKTTNGYLRKAGVDVQGGTEKLGFAVPREVIAEVISLMN